MDQERPLADDTTLLAERQQFEVWSRMTSVAKFAAFGQLMEMAEAIAEAGIRQRYPHAGGREVFLRRAARTLGRATMVKVYGWDPAAYS